VSLHTTIRCGCVRGKRGRKEEKRQSVELELKGNDVEGLLERERKGKATDEREDELLTADGRKRKEVSTLYVSLSAAALSSRGMRVIQPGPVYPHYIV